MPQSLESLLETAFALLKEGAERPNAPFHTPTLATTGPDGGPRLRTVVLRAWDRTNRRLEIHTDTRSGKHSELLQAPVAALHGWDPAARIQLRIRGTVRLHVADAVCRTAWDRLRPASRATYAVMPGPGTLINHPQNTAQTDESAGFPVFCVIHLTCHELEWLHLEQGSYARARFCWDNGTLTPMWLVP